MWGWGVVMIFWGCGVVVVVCGWVWDWFEKKCKFWMIFGWRAGGRRARAHDRGRQPGWGIRVRAGRGEPPSVWAVDGVIQISINYSINYSRVVY